jgi:hypothetical protein
MSSSAIDPAAQPATNAEDKHKAVTDTLDIEAPIELNSCEEQPVKPTQRDVATIERVTLSWKQSSLWAVFISYGPVSS